MDQPNADGETLRARLEVIERLYGKRDPQLDLPTKIPTVCKNAWEVFWKLNKKRTNNGFGLDPISESNIYYYQKNRDDWLTEFEIEVIDTLDTHYIEKHNGNKL